MEARRAHNPKVAGSSPAPATRKKGRQPNRADALFAFLGVSDDSDSDQKGPTHWIRFHVQAATRLFCAQVTSFL